MQDKISKVTDTELDILKVLWDSGKPMTEKEIRISVDQGWTSGATNRMIMRLLDKGVLQRERKDNLFYYSSTVTEDEFTEVRTMDFLNKVYGGNAKNLVSTLLNKEALSENDMDNLQNFWQERKRKK